jgi:hypothetical protein
VPRIANAEAEASADDDTSGLLGGADDPPEPEPIEPESPSPENAVFVVLGVLATVALLGTVVFPGAL